MENKISRICWNTEGWKFPSGSKGKSMTSIAFEHESGFGHEEWLFDKSRIVDGFHYAFLQPLNLLSNRHVGKNYNIYLFTTYYGIKYYVGMIKNAECISKDKSEEIHFIYKRNGWLKEMAKEIVRAGADPSSINNISPESLFNIKFDFSNVSVLDDLEEISDKDPNITTTRYKLLPLKNKLMIVAEIYKDETEGKLKNTKKRKRTYKADTSIDPYHDKMQNALYELLKRTHRKEYEKVLLESNRVDIKAKTHKDKWHYFEIKTDSPKLSIRNALGQIMEYAFWPDVERAEKLIVVSDMKPDRETLKYLSFIRNRFNIPVFYRYFDLYNDVMSEDF